ncbi:MAG: extracellular solute-binding protein, partial [bacterium]
EYPDIDIDVKLIPWQDAWRSIMTAASEKKGPDILQVGSTWNGTLAHLGVLKEITQEVYDSNIASDNFVPAAWSSCQFPGSQRISSLPWFTDIRAMYYRADIFRERNLSGEELDDWHSFEKTCKKLKGFMLGDKEIGVFGVSGQQDAMLVHNIAAWIWGAGGDFLTPDGKEAAFNSDESLNGIAFFIKLISSGYIPISALGLNTAEIARKAFTDGEYSIAIPGPLSDSSPLDPGHLNYRSEIAENINPILFPAGAKGRFVFCGGSNLAVTSFSPYPQNAWAWEFVKYLSSYESQIRYPQRLNMFPGLLESFDTVSMKEKSEWRGLKDVWKYGRSFPNVSAWGEIEALLVECLGSIFSRIQEGNYDFRLVKEDLDKAVMETNTLLKK